MKSLKRSKFRVQSSKRIFPNLSFTLLTISLIFLVCQKKEPNLSASPPPSSITLSFEMDESFSGKRLYRITARQAIFYEEKGLICVTEPVVYFFDEGKINSILTARKGEVFTKTSDLIASGEVQLITSDSTYLFTDSLVWNNSKQMIETDALVRIESKKAKMEGQGLLADAALAKITIKSEIKGSSPYQFK